MITAEVWHPNIQRSPYSLRQMQRAEKALEQRVVAFFDKQRAWVMGVWPALLPADQVPAGVAKDVDKELEKAAEDFADRVRPALAVALAMGARAAMQEVGKRKASEGEEFAEFLDPEMGIMWNVGSPEAQAFLQGHALELAKGINDTTKGRIREVLNIGLREGLGRDDLALRVRGVADDMVEWRARLIAQTEVIRAYTQGSLQVYELAGAERKEWLDGQSEACQQCQDLDGTTAELKGYFEGGLDGPPAHPGCRCSIAAAE